MFLRGIRNLALLMCFSANVRNGRMKKPPTALSEVTIMFVCVFPIVKNNLESTVIEVSYQYKILTL